MARGSPVDALKLSDMNCVEPASGEDEEVLVFDLPGGVAKH